MKKLCELVDVVTNNENCVVFKPKDDTRMDLIALGCFKGNEEMIRMTKGRTPEITVFYNDGSHFSYHFGEGSTTLVTDNIAKQREMIRECAILDYGIVCDFAHMPGDIDYESLIRQTMHIRTLDDAERSVSLNSGGGMSCNIRVNEQTMALHMDVRDVPAWFEARGYDVEFERPIMRGLPCGCVYGYCEPVFDAGKALDVGDISKERFSVLFGNAISLLSGEHENDALFYDLLYNDIGMTDAEIKAVGCGDCIPKAVDDVLLDAKGQAEAANNKGDDFGLNQEPAKE